MAELYTRDQLDEINLPGYMSEATLVDALAPDTDWQTVLSLTLVREGPGGYEIQDGIRRRDTNPTHPDVVSTPTGRIPKSVARLLIEEKFEAEGHEAVFWQVDEVNPQQPRLVTRLKGNAEKLPDNEQLLPHAAGGLLGRKLGCSEALEASTPERPFGTVSLSTVLAGFSYASDRIDAGGEQIPLYEPLLMLGAIVKVHDANAIPRETASYREVSWVGFEEYREGFRGREAGLLIPGISIEDEVKVCVRGLCLATSNATIADPQQIAEHLVVQE